MSLPSTLLSILSIAALVQGFPLDDPDLVSRATGEKVTGSLAVSGSGSGGSGGSSSGTSSYTMYTGDGSDWPSLDKWIGSFEDMFNNNKQILSSSCSQWNVPNNSEEEISAIHDGVLTVSKQTNVDPKYIFATIMQESGGCVRVPSTNGGVQNPGIMQDHDGSANCINVNPCPASTITKMISEGTAGTASGDGLANCLNQAASMGGKGAQAFYWASRIYNTGSYIAGSDLGKPKYGTSCYSSDMANRLTGWVGLKTSCTLPNP